MGWEVVECVHTLLSVSTSPVPASETLFLVFSTVKTAIPNQKDWFDFYYYIILYKNKYQIEKNMSGWEWDRVRVSRLGTRMGRNRNNYSTLNERVRSTRTTTVRLGHVTPQAPGHRTIYCNDREANQPVRFKVWRFLSLIYLFIFLNSPLFGCWENLKEGRKFIRLKNCWIWLRYCLHGFDDGQNQDSNFGGPKCKDFIYLLCKLVLTKYEHWKC